MSSWDTDNILFAAAFVATVAILVCGGVKGCEVDRKHNEARYEGIAKCVSLGGTPLECRIAIGGG